LTPLKDLGCYIMDNGGILMDHIAEIEALKSRIVGRDTILASPAAELGALEEIAEAGTEVVGVLSALVGRVHSAIAAVDQPDPKPAPSPAEVVEEPPADFVPRNHAPDAPAEQP